MPWSGLQGEAIARQLFSIEKISCSAVLKMPSQALPALATELLFPPSRPIDERLRLVPMWQGESSGQHVWKAALLCSNHEHRRLSIGYFADVLQSLHRAQDSPSNPSSTLQSKLAQ